MVEITRYCLVLTTRHNNSSLSYSYDAVGELTGATGTLNGSNYSVSYSYDLNGNRTMAGYQTGTGNELLSDGTYNYTYDKDGNLVSQTNIATGSVTYYTWDYRNRLVEVKEESSSGTVLNDEKFTYDVFNNRIAVSLNGTPELYTVYDGSNPYMDFNGSGQLTERYLYNPNALSQFYGQVSANGTVQWFLTDNINSIRQVVSSNGNVLDAITYDPYGNIINQTNAANAPRFLYAGGAYDSLTGYDQFGRRYYDPSDGRWTSQDPLGFKAGDTNLYRYTGNSPLNRTDSSGLAWSWITTAIGAAAGAASGFGVGVGHEVYMVIVQGKEWNWNYVGISTGIGTVQGAVGGAVVGMFTGDPSSVTVITIVAPVVGGGAGGFVGGVIRGVI